MLDIQITGTLPTLPKNPIPGAMEKIAKRMEDSIRMNFLMGGRPDAWAPLKSGAETPLVASGAMMRNISSTFDDNSATAGMLDNIMPWYWAHQEGATIQHPGSTTSPIPMVINGALTFRWMKEPYTINIPARPYVMFQDSDIEYILNLISNAILTGVHNEPIATS